MGSLNLWGAVPKRAQGTSGVQFPKGHRESGTVMFQDSHVAKLLGLGVGVDRSCSPPPDAALSGSGWDSSAFLSQLSRQPSQVEETEVWEGCEPCVVARVSPTSSDLVPMVGTYLGGGGEVPVLQAYWAAPVAGFCK